MKQLVEVMAKALVEYPDQVEVTEKNSGNTTIIELRVAASDMGKVIGKQGRIAKAMRTVLKAQAMKLNENVVLEILD
jgi:predicted RNA-binding protein YlqC (UPF0109 family)